MSGEWFEEDPNPSEWKKPADWDPRNEIEDLDNGICRPQLPTDMTRENKVDDGGSWKCEKCGRWNRNQVHPTVCYYCYLDSFSWEVLRGRKIQKEGFTCEECGIRNVKLEVHHITYERLGEEHLTDLQVLCNDCHKKVELSKYNPKKNNI